MPQKDTWEKEYASKKPTLITKSGVPNVDVRNFAKYLKRVAKVELSSVSLLDLGSGNGKNALYFAEKGANVSGLEISPTAVSLAQKQARASGLDVSYKVHDIGTHFPFADSTFDVALDIMSSNSLSENERDVYLSETERVLKARGYFYVKALLKDGDKNARELLKEFPGVEQDTYILPKLNLTERIWSKKDFLDYYKKFFTLAQLETKESYTRFEGQPYKRRFLLAYFQKVIN